MHVSLAALSALTVSVYASPGHVQSSTGVTDPAVSTPSESLSPTLIDTILATFHTNGDPNTNERRGDSDPDTDQIALENFIAPGTHGP